MKSFFRNGTGFSAASAQCAEAVTSCARLVLSLDAIRMASIFVALALALVLAGVLCLLILIGLLIMLALLLRGTSEYNLGALEPAQA